MKYVYILQSLADSSRFYTGLANDLKVRLFKHNAREVPAHLEIRSLGDQDLFGVQRRKTGARVREVS